MKRMDDDTLLGQLQALEEDSSAFTWGRLGQQRERNMREYFRMPYGNEEEGLSSIVTSEVQDTIEWIMPDLLDIFCSTDKAVVFEPTRAQDVKGAEQATDAVNYVFHKQNNGFLNLYTAFKDALQVKNCAIMWRKETRRTKVIEPVNGASLEMLTMLLAEGGNDAEIESAEPLPVQPTIDPLTLQPIMGEQLFKARIARYESKTTIKVDAFPPEDLLVKRDWTTPLLTDCPYVCRNMAVTLSELHEMGYKDVTAEDLDSSDEAGLSADSSFRQTRAGTADDTAINQELSTDDEAMTRGYLRIEFVLMDYDGDGIAERRCIYRLKDKILSNEECSHVPIATASPILIQHRWDGMSIAEAVSDLQVLSTELTRQMVDSGRLALNPRTKVLTDSNNAPLANIDDLLDSRAGGIVRMRGADAVQEMITPWVGGQMFPMLEYKDSMLEKRTGVSPQSQGLDPNSINRGGAYETKVMNAAKMRIKLIARVFAEVLLKPTFQGILKLLTDGEMEKIAMRLRGEFVEYDPNEWRDSYDMTSNVGLGTGDTQQQTVVLQAIGQAQALIAQSPWGELMVSPKQVYNTQAKLVENAGFKNVGDFFMDPGDKKPEPKPPAPDPQVIIADKKLQADAQKFQATSQLERERMEFDAQAKQREQENELTLQASNDERDAQRQLLADQNAQEIALRQLELDRYKIDQDNETKIIVAEIAAGARTDAAVLASQTTLAAGAQSQAEQQQQQFEQSQQGLQP